jgi:hypothetical protein
MNVLEVIAQVKMLKQHNLSMLVDPFFEFSYLISCKNIFPEPPVVSTDNSYAFISPGDNVDLTCSVAGQTFPDIRWFKGNEPVRICEFKNKI